MVKEKKTFIIYKQFAPLVLGLSNEKAGLLFKALFDYTLGNEIIIPKSIEPIFPVFKVSIDDNDTKWEEERQKRRDAGSKGGKAKAKNAKQALANPSNANQSQAKLAVNDNVNANAYVNDNENVNENGDESLSSSNKFEGECDLMRPEYVFDLFWKIYPKRVEKGKVFDWFERNYRLLTRKFVDNMLGTINDFVKYHVQWSQEGDRFIPYPLKWLESGGYDDELTPEEMKGKKRTDENGGFDEL